MNAIMLKPTYWNGVRRRIGDTVNVDKNVAERWERAGIARIVEEKPLGDEKKPIARMTSAELAQKAEELGVDISACGNNEQRAAAIQASLDSNTENSEV